MPDAIKQKLFSKSGLWFYFLAFGGLIYASYHIANIKKITMLMRGITPAWLIVAVAAQLLTYVCVAGVYKTLFRLLKTGITYTFREFYKFAILIVFVNQALPSGGISGSAFLFRQSTKKGTTAVKAFLVFIMESLTLYIGAYIGITLAIVGYLLYAHNVISAIFTPVIIIGYVFFAILFTVLVVLGNPRIVRWLSKQFEKYRLTRFLLRYLAHAPAHQSEEAVQERPLQILAHNPRAYIGISLMHLGVLCSDAVTVYALFRGLGIHPNMLVVFFGFVMTFIVASLPLSPGALIVYEGSMTFFYTTLGIPFEAAIVATLAYRILSFWLPMAAGIFLYRNLDNA